jgi:hypothetical protein
MMTEAFPLSWPTGVPRVRRSVRSQFGAGVGEVTVGKVRDGNDPLGSA